MADLILLPAQEFVSKRPAYLDFPRCPYEVLRTDKYDSLINNDIFLELVWDCVAWGAWQYFEVPYQKGGYREIPGSAAQYSGDFPLWRLSYSMLPLLRICMLFHPQSQLLLCDKFPSSHLQDWKIRTVQ